MNKAISNLIGGITIASSLAIAGTAIAWGPSDRPTYTNAKPADYATFNSITDNVAVGDERNFVRVRELGTENTYSDEVKVEPGKEYEVYLYYHNNAGSDTNASGVGLALQTKAAATYPAKVTKGANGTLTGEITWRYITSKNDSTVHDGKVWDEATLTTDYDEVVLRYKPGSATIHNDGKINGSILSTNLFAEGGTYIGYNSLNGVVPGCAEYSGHITYTLVADKIDSTLSKMVSLDGENWAKEVTAKPGDYVTYRVAFQNTGNTTMTNVILKDTHDDGLTLRSGSTKVFDINNTEGKQIDDILDISGYNTGDAIPSALVQVTYQAQVGREQSLCNKALNNTITASYNSTEQKTDTASVLVTCDEPEPETPVEDCKNNPNLPGCQDCTTNPDLPECQEKNCKTNPEMEGCQELPNTGPLEIVLAIIIIAGIGGVGYYFYRTKKTLKTVEKDVSGKESPSDNKKDAAQSDQAKQPESTEKPKSNK